MDINVYFLHTLYIWVVRGKQMFSAHLFLCDLALWYDYWNTRATTCMTQLFLSNDAYLLCIFTDLDFAKWSSKQHLSNLFCLYNINQLKHFKSIQLLQVDSIASSRFNGFKLIQSLQVDSSASSRFMSIQVELTNGKQDPNNRVVHGPGGQKCKLGEWVIEIAQWLCPLPRRHFPMVNTHVHVMICIVFISIRSKSVARILECIGRVQALEGAL